MRVYTGERILIRKSFPPPHNLAYVIYTSGSTGKPGNIEFSKHSRSGWLGTVSVAGKGSFFGENSVMNGNPSFINAEVILGDIRTLTFTSQDIKRLLRKYPELAMSLLKEMSIRVEKLSTLVVDL